MISIARCISARLPADSVGGVHVVPVYHSPIIIAVADSSDEGNKKQWKSSVASGQDNSSDKDGDGDNSEVELMIEDDSAVVANSALDLLLDYTDDAADGNVGIEDNTKVQEEGGCKIVAAVQKSCSALSLQIGDRLFLKRLLKNPSATTTSSSTTTGGFLEVQNSSLSSLL